MKNIIALIILTFLTSCGSPNPNINKSDHFNGEVFHNLNEPKLEKSFKDFLKWRFKSKNANLG